MQLLQLLVYQTYGTLSLPINVFLLFVVGILVNGPYALITTSVSAELGSYLIKQSYYYYITNCF